MRPDRHAKQRIHPQEKARIHLHGQERHAQLQRRHHQQDALGRNRRRHRRSSSSASARRGCRWTCCPTAKTARSLSDRGADPASAHDPPGGVHRSRRDDLPSGVQAAGATAAARRRALAHRLRKTVPEGCRRRQGDDGGLVQTGGRGRDHHLSGRRHRRRRGPSAPPRMVAKGARREVARARQSRRRPGEPDPPVRDRAHSGNAVRGRRPAATDPRSR